jgi:surface protein
MATIPDILNDSWDGYKREDVRLGLQAKLRELQKTIEELQGSGQEIIDLDAEVDNGDIILTLVVDEENPVNNRSVRLPISTAVAGKLSENEDTGRLDYSKAPCMVLASMGTSLDGGSRYMMHAGDTFYSEQSNDLIYCKQVARLIHIAPDKAVLYCNAMTGKLYRWNGSGMVEVADKLTNSQASKVMDLIDESMNTGSHLLCLASMGADYDVFDGEAWEYDPQGEEMYFDGTFIRRADDDSLMEDPDQSKLYFNLRTRLFYVWDGGTFANVGGGSSEEFDQGKYNRLKSAINNLNGRVSALIGALANLAFEDEFTDPFPNGPWPATPSGDKVTVSIDNGNLNDAFVEGNTSIEIGTGGSVTIAVKPDEGKFLRELKYAVGEGAQSTAMVNDSTKRRALITINNVTSDITVHLYGYADDPKNYTVSLPSDLEFTDHNTQATALEGSSFSRDVQLADPDEGVTLKSVTVQYNYNGSTQIDTSPADEQGVCHIEIDDFTGISQVSFTTESAGETYNVTFDDDNDLLDTFRLDSNVMTVSAGGTYSNTIRAKDGFNLVDVTIVSGTYQGFTKTLNQSTDSCAIELTGVQSDITISVATEADTQPVTQFVVGPGSLTQLTLSPSGDVMVDGNGNGNYRGKLSLADNVTGKRLPDEIVLVGSRQQSLQSLSPQSQSSALSGLTPRPDLDVVSLESSVLGELNYDYLCDSFSYNPGTGDININGVKHDIYINAIAQDDVVTRKLTLKLLNIAPTDEVNEYAMDSFGYPYAMVATNGDFEIVLEGIVTDETLGTRATLNGDVAVKSGGVVLFKQGGSNNVSDITLSDVVVDGVTMKKLTIASTRLAAVTADIIIEATACTGQIVLTAKDENSKFAFSYTDGENETVSVATTNWNTDSNTGITSVAISCSELKAIWSAETNPVSFLYNTKIKSIDFGGAKFSGSSLYRMFDGCTSLESVKGLVITDDVANISSMFYGCSSLNEVDTIGWDLSSVVNMNGLFNSCGNLTSVDLGSKDVSSLQNAGSSAAIVSAVFYNCTNLENLDVSYWNAPALEDLYGFICNCTKLKSFDASTWNVNAAVSIQGMFVGCSGLKSIDISGIDTSVTKNISFLFRGATKLESITIKDFVTSDVENISSMFYQTRMGITLHCKSADVPDVSVTDSLNWIKAARGYINKVMVPVGSLENYRSAWKGDLGLNDADFDVE